MLFRPRAPSAGETKSRWCVRSGQVPIDLDRSRPGVIDRHWLTWARVRMEQLVFRAQWVCQIVSPKIFPQLARCNSLDDSELLFRKCDCLRDGYRVVDV